MRRRKTSPPRLPKWHYQNYINSLAWRNKRQQYFDSKLPQKCLVCDSRTVDLHHRTYKRLGNEWLNDLVPLCRQHHDECHAFIKSKKLNLWGGTKLYVRVAKEQLLKSVATASGEGYRLKSDDPRKRKKRGPSKPTKQRRHSPV